MMRRVVALVLALLALSIGFAVASSPAAAQTDPASTEADFVADINALRASKGLGLLTVDPELVAVARSWAASMAKVDQISHNPKLAQSVQADWQKLGENVGVGMTEDKLHQAFIDSPSHYKNLVDPDFSFIGVGVVMGRDGAIFTAHTFMQLRPAAAPAAAAPAPKPKPPATTTTTAPAPPVEEQVAPAAPEPAPVAAITPPTPPRRLVLVLEQLRALDPR